MIATRESTYESENLFSQWAMKVSRKEQQGYLFSKMFCSENETIQNTSSYERTLNSSFIAFLRRD